MFIGLVVTLSTYCYRKTTWWRPHHVDRQEAFLTPWDLTKIHSFTDISKCIFPNESLLIAIQISPKFVPECPKIISTKSLAQSVLDQVTAWCRAGNKPLSVPMLIHQIYHAMWYHQRCFLVRVSNLISLDLLHKSHNAPVSYSTMHHSVTEMCTCVYISVTKWCIVGHLSNALRDLWDGSSPTVYSKHNVAFLYLCC